MKFMWEGNDLRAGRRVKMPTSRCADHMLVRLLTNPEDGKEWGKIDLNGGVMHSLMTRSEMVDLLNHNGYVPVEFLEH